MNPFAKEAMKVFKRVKFEPCAAIKSLTSVESFGADSMRIVVHQKLKKDYLSWWQTEIEVSYLNFFLLIATIKSPCLLSAAINE